ncbi:restriction endonuclease subunit S [Lacticaseibacillus rhamnosus]|uniref:restriction endonuclease subunit S n=1 Tax=Lacticaseibacillus rhamnosus TaxID=47715 RepID=UPI0007DF39CE|nr:restriction endonuclease subunit S [Lacticaseibacillus rhamnosus]MCT3191770.1 restriction endonuclease subunit S [Lacticaseibacillus rhamnosus]MCT3373818.1 restriction endonuclease subunit S [Lacticaseibacillus rhamnosus]OAU13146.1 restriction endonuclease [Lacticaseibacillus rhamnosus]OAU16648.1 restriction endonuclease [Lacticaseibacillus rhamnosus]OAU19525.1 restriction endonuclease [Lacticaseibacillus rhamnosus]
MAKIDDSVKKKVPELRFKGFTDPWVQRNLADLSDGFSYGLNAAAKEYDGVHGYLRITDIDEVSHSFLPEGLTSPDVPENQLTDYRMDEQSIVYARTGASTGKTYIYRDSDGELYYAGFLIRQKVNKETSAQFVYQNTLTKAWERYVQVMSQRSGQPGINAQEVGRFELTIPEKAEQDKIAHLFNSLDNLIAANQRKLDLLKEQKKGYLQKMFPKNGSKFPQLRFAGFADAWEQRKLGAITDSFSGGTPTAGKAEYYGGEIPFIRSGEISSDSTELFITDAGLNNSSAKMVGIGDILYALYGATSGETSISRINGAINQAILAIRPTKGDDPYMIVQWLKKQKETIISTYLQGGQGNLSGSIVKDLLITLPKNKDEQAKVGSFFKQLDQTITLHQRKLEKLQELKKGYLQKMFC